LKSPAGPGSAQPEITVAPDGRVFLTWLEPGPDGDYILRFSSREGLCNFSYKILEGLLCSLFQVFGFLHQA
jgi:hypothetical protein